MTVLHPFDQRPGSMSDPRPNEVTGLAGDGSVRLTSEMPEVLAWARAHLVPTSVDYRGTGWTGWVDAVVDRDLLVEYGRRARSIDASPRRLYDDSGYLVSHHGEDTVYVLAVTQPDAARHAVLVRPGRAVVLLGEDPGSHQAPLRVIRSLTRGALLDGGGLLMHASAVAGRDGGGGVVFVGASGTGKTTTALRSAAQGAPLVSTDRVVLRPGPEGPRAIGGPDLVRVGLGAARALGISDIGGRVIRKQPEDRLLAREGAIFASRTKIETGIAELGVITGWTVSDTTPVRTLVVLEHSNVDEPDLRPSTLDAEWPRIRGELLHPDPRHGYPFAPSMLSRTDAESSLHRLCSDLDVRVLRWSSTRWDCTGRLLACL